MIALLRKAVAFVRRDFRIESGYKASFLIRVTESMMLLVFFYFLSNLITTRSDTFTVYVVVQGWRNAGTTSAYPVITRRAAFIVDRNSVTPLSKTVRTETVPN